jgi:TetR/AcrR family transcriptional regulator, cholesterol catabolism regulator
MLIDLKDILEQVAILYSKYGIKSNTMDDVARELGISKKTLYQSFKDKDDLVNKVTDSLFLKRQIELQRIINSEHNAIEEMYLIHRHIIGMLKDYSNVMMNDLRKYYFEKYNENTRKYKLLLEDIMIKNFEKGKSEGIYRLNINNRIIARSHVAMVMNLPESNVLSINEYTAKDFSDELFEYHLRGMLNERSINISEQFLKKINENKYVDHEGSQIN